MDGITEAAPSGGEQTPAPINVHTAGGAGPLTAQEAARSVTDWRRKGAGTEQAPEASAATATPAKESVDEAGATPPATEANGETQEPEPQANEPAPIEAPKSWTKDARDRFASLPRETQEYIANREQERDREVRRSQNEAAEQRKAIEAERVQVTQTRQQYEQALPVLLQNLQAQIAGNFADIKSPDDAVRLAHEDPARYIQWQAQQQQLAAVYQQAEGVRQRQASEFQTRLTDFMKSEAEKFADRAPEAKDPAQLDKLQKSAVSMLKDHGFKDDELSGLWRGDSGVSLHDHRFQLILRDAVKYREAQASTKAIKEQAKPVPLVQRPGAAPNKGAAREAALQGLSANIDNSSGLNQLRAAAKLLAERRRA